MKVKIEYDNGLVEVLRTEGEASLSSDVMAQAESTGFRTKAAATLFRVRADRLEDEGLRIELWWYSTKADDQWMTNTDLSGTEQRLHNLSLEKGRSWVLLDPGDLARVTLIDIEGCCRLRKRGGCFVNETKFEEQLAYWYGNGLDDQSAFDKAKALHKVISEHYPDWDSARVAESYGYPARLWRRIMEQDAGVPIERPTSQVERLTDALSALLAEDPSLTPSVAFNQLGGEKMGITFDLVRQVWDVASALAGVPVGLPTSFARGDEGQGAAGEGFIRPGDRRRDDEADG